MDMQADLVFLCLDGKNIGVQWKIAKDLSGDVALVGIDVPLVYPYPEPPILRNVQPPAPLCGLFEFLLPIGTRQAICEPAYNELLQDYLHGKKQQIDGSGRWLTFRFGLATMLLVADCWRVLLVGKVFGFLLALVPAAIRRWWRS